MKNKILKLLFMLLLASTLLFSVSCKKDNEPEIEGLKYQLSQDGTYYSVVGHVNFTSADLVIPDTYNDLPVEEIGTLAFSNCKMKTVRLGKNVKRIQPFAFYKCLQIEKVYTSSIESWLNIDFVVNSEYGSYNDSLYSTNPLFIKESNLSSESNNAELYANNQLVTDLKIPSSVTEINSFAFLGYKHLTGVEIPQTVTHIGHYAFSTCSNLKSLTISEGVTYIGSAAFNKCESLTSVTIPNSVTELYSSAFASCYNLTSVTLGNGISTIYEYTFAECENLMNINIPDSVTSIKTWAFFFCENLLSITIPNSVKQIDSEAFEYCSNLVEVINKSSHITVEKGSEENGGVGYYAISVSNCDNSYVSKISTENGFVIFADNDDKILVKYLGEETNLVLPEALTQIYSNCFYDNENILSITIGNNVTTIGESAFSGCTNLANVTFGENVTSIEQNAFSYCESLENVVLNDKITFLGDSAFDHCSNLKSIDLSASLKTISAYAFQYCKSLTAITIPNSIESIKVGAFFYCYSLATINLPDTEFFLNPGNFEETALYKNESNWQNGLLYIGNHLIEAKDTISGDVAIKDGTISIRYYAFDYCVNVTSISIPASVTLIECPAFSDCNLSDISVDENNTSYKSVDGNLYSKDGKLLLQYATGKNESQFVMPDDVTTIAPNAFNNSNLSKIELSDNLTTIGMFAFETCDNLTSITIPSKVSRIEDCAFISCYRLAEVINYSQHLTIEKNSHENGSLGYNAYAITNCTEPNTVVESKILEIDDYIYYKLSPTERVLLGYVGEEKDLYLDSFVVEINKYAFYGQGNISSLTFGNSVTYIGTGAFSFNPYADIDNLYYTGSLTDWCKITFESGSANPITQADKFYIQNEQVTNLNFNGFIKEIKDYAFTGLNSLAIVELSSITTVGKEAFAGCENLTRVSIGYDVTYIGKNCFRSCPYLTNVTFKDTANWFVSSFSDTLESIDVTDAAKNAEYFARTYCDYSWHKQN